MARQFEWVYKTLYAKRSHDIVFVYESLDLQHYTFCVALRLHREIRTFKNINLITKKHNYLTVVVTCLVSLLH